MSTAIPPRGPERFAIPPLENGDHLTRDEFERRSNAMPNLSKAELLEGVVYMPAATRASYEISASTVSYDLNVKLPIYRRNGVKEYVVWRVLDEAIDWFVLRGSEYVKQPIGAEGLLKSVVFPVQWVNPHDLIQQSMDSMLKTLDRGLAAPEHQVFVTKLHHQPKA